MSRMVFLFSVSWSLLGLFCDSANSETKPAKSNTKPLDESKEPPLKYTIEIGGKSLEITEGQTISLSGTFTNPQVKLTPHPYRLFSYQGLSFQYPRAFTFESDLADVDNKNWIISGNDFTILYFVMNYQATTREFADDLMDQLGHENCTVANASPIHLGGKELIGTMVTATIAGHKIRNEIYHLPSNKKQSKLLVFQDTLDDMGNRSAEGEATLKLLKQTTKFEP